MRILQFVPELARYGIQCDVSTLFSDGYLRTLYTTGRRDARVIARNYLSRVASLDVLSSYDTVWLDKELLPWLPTWVESRFLARCKRLVVEYDDATFHSYDRHSWKVVRYALGGKIDRIMARADVVVAGNDYIAERAAGAGAQRTVVIPTVVDLRRYPEPDAGRFSCSQDRRVVWVGSPSSAGQLAHVAPALQDVCLKTGVRLRLIGAGSVPVAGVPVERLAWTEESEVSLLKGNYVGIMPLVDNPWNRGKCGYKLTQYMACGLPVVASPVGVNVRMVESGRNGFLAGNIEEWHNSLLTILSDPAVARAMGDCGRSLVAQKYCLDAVVATVATALGARSQGS